RDWSVTGVQTCALPILTGEAAGLGRDWSKAANRVPLDHEGPITAVEQVRNSWGEASQWSAKLSHGRWRRRRRWTSRTRGSSFRQIGRASGRGGGRSAWV